MDEQRWGQLFKELSESPSPVDSDDQSHLDSAVLFNYLDDLLDPADEQRVQDHLANCRGCSDMLLELREPLAFDVNEPVPADTVAAWEALKKQDPDEAPSYPPQRLVVHSLALPKLPWLVAVAALVLAGFSWLVPLPFSVNGNQLPMSNIRIVPLESVENPERNGTQTAVFNHVPNVLALSYGGTATAANFYLSIETQSGESLWREPATRDASGMFTAYLPAHSLPVGAYTIILSSDDATVSRYQFVVLDKEPSLL